METVDFKKAPGQLDAAADFLRDHVRGKVKAKNGQIQVEGTKHKDLKLILHKFVRHRGLDGYRVLSQSGVLEIVPPHLEQSVRHEKGTAPSAAATMPYFFPGSPPVPIERRFKKKQES